MARDDYWRLSATELLAGYARKDFSPVEVAASIFARIEKLNPLLNSFLALNRNDAMKAAKRAEQTWLSPGEKPLLCGVPVSIKDSIEMAGMPTTYGSLAFKNNMQPDALIVQRLRVAGAVLLGKTNLPEFALHGRVDNKLGPVGTNPWNLDHSCGGSSGGAGSAVAAGLGPLAVGTDSGGSIRQPAAYNGIFGLKPSFQRIPAVQTWRASPGRSHNGPMTRTVRDSALLMNVMAGPDTRDPDSLLYEPIDYIAALAGNIRDKRVAVSLDLGANDNDAMQQKLLDEAVLILRDLGCTIVKADPPRPEPGDELEPGVWAYSGDHYGAAEAIIPGFWEKHKDDLTDYARPVYDGGRRALAWQYRKILRRNRAYVERMKEWFSGYDYLLTQVTGPAISLADAKLPKDAPALRKQMYCLQPFNIGYVPAAAIPFGYADNGLPLSIQIVGKHGDDGGVLRVSALFEALHPWAHRWPELAEKTV
jgi:aspartyl-tRNA(Asn)/glutamyl-tRNA(Gln) amidotransferase subunit A